MASVGKRLIDVHDAFICIDASGLISDWDSQAQATFGWSRDDVLGRDLAAIGIPQADRDAHPQTALHRDGHEFPIELTISALETQHGDCVIAFVRDITEHTAADESLERERPELMPAYWVGGLGSWEWDIAGGAIRWSAQLCRIYGVEPGGERSYAEFLSLVHPDDRARMQATVQTAYKTGRPYVLEHRIVRPDGVIRVLRGRGAVISDDAQRPVRMLGTGQDITEQIRCSRVRQDRTAVSRGV
jgi:PAS domain S-box-containing protein